MGFNWPVFGVRMYKKFHNARTAQADVNNYTVLT